MIKPQPLNDVRMISACGVWSWELDGEFIGESKPRYQVGEVVYIKEAWCPLIAPIYNLLNPTIPTVYKQEMDAGGATLPKEFKWHSPMRMPEWAARYFIKITDIRAERLRLPLSPEELKLEGGELTLSILEKINGLWVFVYSFKKAEK